MQVKSVADPVGTTVAIQGLNDLVEKMKAAWEGIASATNVNWTIAIQFLTKGLDDMVVYLVEHNIPGQDKKATVLEAIGKVYDWVSKNIVPFYLKPFSGLMRDFVINTVLSNSIDWIVSKYNSGSWHPEATSQVYKTWGLTK